MIKSKCKLCDQTGFLDRSNEKIEPEQKMVCGQNLENGQKGYRCRTCQKD